MIPAMLDELIAAMDRATEQFKRIADALERANPTPEQRDRTFVEFTPINDREGN